MIPFEFLNDLFHNIGSAAQDAGTQGWLPEAIGGILGGSGGILKNAVHQKIEENQASQTNEQKLKERSQKLW
ncbi:hypothetical protein CO172_02550 [Candidatus Uhrbacteria bacterium CG_4_9_14_3_um_filter_36_7]|uniref:Uncharacterized protein n=1 Tax=Candidatus Uhrbacteria bacterium CG_4_9_14_3_um_filter_36_7 TaxID=1975033 RepID=A0A2M7XH94_9BACT|nr:MAG: hypothetical protein CO172_02550 [Candidatus Uhrbacteria bacterium CG_4_9_14_3_um_filter_36_7]